MIDPATTPPLDLYRHYERVLIALRAASGGRYTDAEGFLLEDMDAAWARLTDAEIAIIDAEGPRAQNVQANQENRP